MDVDALTDTDIKKLFRRLANLSDAELLFWDRWVQAARRRKQRTGRRTSGAAHGWRAEQAYEDARREDYRRWRASLTLRQFIGSHLHRARHVLAGAAATGLVITAFRWFMG